MRKVLSKEVVLLDASKYPSISEWSKNSRSCYVVASRNGWLKEISVNMGRKRKTVWTESEIVIDAAKYKKMKDWIANSSSAYQAAWKMGIIEKIKINMLPRSRSDVIWCRESILADSSRYKTKSEWENNSPSAYNASRKLGIYQEATKHMPAWSAQSVPEIEIMTHISKIFSDAQKKMFKNDDKNFSFWGLELDIFIPSINKGIEFDGTYWHSFEGLKESRPKWPEKDLLNYHKLKDDWFASRGIRILHIKEKDWNHNKKAQLSKIDDFLRN